MNKYYVYFRGTGNGSVIIAATPTEAKAIFAARYQVPVSAYIAWSRHRSFDSLISTP